MAQRQMWITVQILFLAAFQESYFILDSLLSRVSGNYSPQKSFLGSLMNFEPSSQLGLTPHQGPWQPFHKRQRSEKTR